MQVERVQVRRVPQQRESLGDLQSPSPQLGQVTVDLDRAGYVAILAGLTAFAWGLKEDRAPRSARAAAFIGQCASFSGVLYPNPVSMGLSLSAVAYTAYHAWRAK